MAKYGWTFRWTEKNGNQSCITVRDYSSAREAFEAALGSAIAFGWTEPKWWQWWRRYDQPRSATFAN